MHKAATVIAVLRKAASILEELDLPSEDFHWMSASIQHMDARLCKTVNANKYVIDEIYEELDELFLKEDEDED